MASRVLFRSSARAFSLNQTLSYTNPISSCVGSTFLSKRFYADKTITIKDFGGAETVQSGELQEWMKNEGEFVEIDDEIVSIATEKTSITIVAEEEGLVKKHLKEEGDTLNLGDDLFILDPDAKAPEVKEQPKEDTTTKEQPKEVTKQAEPAKKKAPKKSADAPPPREARTSVGSETRVKMSPMRARIAERLKDSQNTAAMLTTFQECDMSGLMNMRKEFKDEFLETHDAKLGFMSAFVKASTSALLKERAVNAYIDGNEIVYKDYVDINIAVATPTGLVTPVLRDCQEMSFADVEKEIASLGAKARKGKITIADMEGGTFTISNGGAFGSMMGTPIINPPQSAILGMHGITKRAVVVNDEIVIRPMMYLALTYDHRLLDGKTAVTFLKDIKQGVEDPRRLLLDL